MRQATEEGKRRKEEPMNSDRKYEMILVRYRNCIANIILSDIEQSSPDVACVP